MRRFVVLSSIAFSLSSFAQQPKPLTKEDLVIIRDIKPDQTDLTDQLTLERETELLQAAILDTYSNALPTNLKEVVESGIQFHVNHTWLPVTKMYLGWAPEDDLEYKYPDVNYCNATTPNGTIKVNFSQKFMKILDLGEKLSTESTAVKEGAQAYYWVTIAHELLHAYQWHTKPVASLSMFPESCKSGNGFCSKEMILGTKEKIKYEEAAFAQSNTIMKPKLDQILKFADAVDKYETDHPTDFKKEAGQYRMLSKENGTFGLATRLRAGVEGSSKATTITGATKVIYFGEYRPCELIWELKDLDKTPYDEAAIKKLVSEWNVYIHSNESATVIKTFPYLKDVKDGFEALLTTMGYKSLLPTEDTTEVPADF